MAPESERATCPHCGRPDYHYHAANCPNAEALTCSEVVERLPELAGQRMRHQIEHCLDFAKREIGNSPALESLIDAIETLLELDEWREQIRKGE